MIVRVGEDRIAATIAWASSASFVHPSTTNNFAGYKGLVWGLAAAARYKFDNLHVVGDSDLILRQL